MAGRPANSAKIISMQNDISLTIDIAKNLLRDLIEEEKTIKDLSISDIMKTVANFYGVTIDDILSAQRTQTLVTPRQLAMFLSRKLTTRSLQEIADEFKDSIKVCKIDVDENRELAMQFRIMSIPTVMFFKGGEAVKREVGAYPKEQYVEMINSL